MDDSVRDDVLRFWFEELTPDDWYATSEAIDRAIRARFLDLHRELASAAPGGGDPETTLAAVIVLDQFSRNMFRGAPEAFATDDQALLLSRHAVDEQRDAGMTDERKQFLYMPFMHSERLADQERGLDLFRRLGNPENVKYAEEHRDIIQRFGRFPHRNKVLGRQSTAAERAFLLGHEGFGQ